MSFLAGILGSVLTPLLGGVMHPGASSAAVSAEEGRFQSDQDLIEFSNLAMQDKVGKKAAAFNRTMYVANEEAKESNLMQNYVITLEDADKKEVEKLTSQITPQ